jgi:hypothetical protein
MSQSAKKGSTQVVQRRGWAYPLAADASKLTDASLIKAGFPDPSLVLRWPEIAGPETAKLAHPIRCRKGPEGMILTLRCETGASVFLQHQTRTLIERLNATLGAGTISRIRIVPGMLQTPDAGAPHPHPSYSAKAHTESAESLPNALDRLANARKALKRRARP